MFPLSRTTVEFGRRFRYRPVLTITIVPASDPACSSNDQAGSAGETKAFGFRGTGWLQRLKLKGMPEGTTEKEPAA
ncbi:hypothetical protein HNY73_011691 [Argiope bruennichi]|uniref:Uncharacterized protein n=1 Tax=Argiope bruennichi TaxID=94029 RepID=A0A8T0EZU5_ARGBR|nr:hypothetical protein HNY73_011691 [Argiope bruennichi]